MRLSSKCLYAIRALFDIAYHGGEDAVSGKEIAEREEVPQRFLEQILLQLKRSGLVTAKRGPKGGYKLSKSPADVSMIEVVEAIDGPLLVSFCHPTDEDARRLCEVKSKCVTAALWRDLAKVIEDHLRSVTLADMVARGEALGVCRGEDDAIFYVI